MIRHYSQRKLKNSDSEQKIGLPLMPVWKLSPYEIAKFSGELIKVMTDAAESYVYQKTLSELRKDFQHELSKEPPSNHLN